MKVYYKHGVPPFVLNQVAALAVSNFFFVFLYAYVVFACWTLISFNDP
jgi:hypothetical protein